MKIIRKLLNDKGMVGGSLVLLFFTHSLSITNVLFHAAMGRMLAADEYGALVAMMSIILILVANTVSIQNSVAHRTGMLAARGDSSAIRAVISAWLSRLALAGMIFLIIAFAARFRLASFFHIDNPSLVVITGMIMFVCLLLPVFTGALQGIQAFAWMSFSSTAWGGIRLAAGILAVLIHPSAISAMTAYLVAMIASTAAGMAGIRKALPETGQSQVARPAATGNSGKYFAASTIALGSYAFLMYADVLMVKSIFPDASVYAPYTMASIISRMIIFIAQPVAYIMFPKVISEGHSRPEHIRLLVRTLLFAFATVSVAALLCSFFPGIPLLIVYGIKEPAPETIWMLQVLSWSMLPLAMSFFLINFELAQRRLSCAIPVLSAALGFVLLSSVFNDTPDSIIYSFGTVCTISFLWLFCLSIRGIRLRP